jgi:tRNA/tmRNA/rRNA uracil-C5-methylase (TrmA/RlmC/RlmD family)
VTVGAVAHGGHCVARHVGQVIFVRHALPDEVVVVEITEIGPRARYLRADVVEVTTASPDRVHPPCSFAGTCGGCDWQHASLSAQRDLKGSVVAEQLRRLGGVEREVLVEAMPGESDGLAWRTRMAYAVDSEGRPGLRRHRSHDVVPIDECPIAHPLVNAAAVTTRRWPGAERIEVAASVSTATTTVSIDGEQTQPLTESAAGRRWRVSSGGFWQVHPGAADALVGAVLDQLAPATGEHAIDLYAGVGLFAGPLAERVGPGGRVDVVEANREAAADASANLADFATVHVHDVSVDRFLRRTPLRHCMLVVLDPPRSGAGRGVLERVTRLGPRAISYVACDPAALGRDTSYLAELGYRLTGLRAFDLFPMTHHVECVASFEPVEVGVDPSGE